MHVECTFVNGLTPTPFGRLVHNYRVFSVFVVHQVNVDQYFSPQ